MRAFEPQISRLIEALMDRMISRDHVDLSSVEVREQVAKFLVHQRATKALEIVSKIYPPDLTFAAVMPLVEKRIKSDSCSEKEAAIEALCVFMKSTPTGQ